MNDNGFLVPLPEVRGTHYDVMLILNRLIMSHDRLRAKIVEAINKLSAFSLFKYKKLDKLYKQQRDIADVYYNMAMKHKDNVDLNKTSLIGFFVGEVQSAMDALKSDGEEYKKISPLLFLEKSKMKRKLYVSALKIGLLKALISNPKFIEDLKGDGDVTFSF